VRVGEFEIVSEAGRGGRGVVLKARARDGSIVALKLLQGMNNDQQALARFDRERRLLSSLGKAEGFVPLLGSGEDRGNPYLVMPFLEGGTLRNRLDKEKFSQDEAVALVLRLAKAMGLAHERGIVHRDLKPENILFTGKRDSGENAPNAPIMGGRGTPLIADLGLGKHFKRSTAGASQTIMLSKEGQFRGTVGYMAPEQTKDAMSAGPPADVFALGAILLECLTGEPAFKGESPVEVLGRLASGDYSKRSSTADDRWLDAIIDKSLEPDPGDRYPDARAMAEALAKGPSGYVPPSRAPRILGAIAAVGGVALLIAGVVRFWPTSSPEENARAALETARGPGDAKVRIAAAELAAAQAGTKDPQTRGEALELAARLLLDQDAKRALEDARAALALGPDQEARQLLVAQAALKLDRPDEAYAAIGSRLDGKTPPLEAFRAGALAHLAHGRAPEAEALAKRGLDLLGEDPTLLLAKGRALRALGKSADAVRTLNRAIQLGEKSALPEEALAAIEAARFKKISDASQVMVASMDQHLDAIMAKKAIDLLDALEKNWPAAKGHPEARRIALDAIDLVGDTVAKCRTVGSAEVAQVPIVLQRLLKLHEQVAPGEATDALGVIASLALYEKDVSLAVSLLPRLDAVSPRIRFAVRASIGMGRFVPVTASSLESCRFDGDESPGIESMELALSEDPRVLAEVETEDRFFQEIHRNTLRVLGWALWHRAVRDPSRGDDLPKAEKFLREAYGMPPIFPAFGNGPVLVALIPVLLVRDELDEAEKFISEFEGFHTRWQGVKKSAEELGRDMYTATWGEAYEVRGDLELRRGHYEAAARAFEKGGEEGNSRSSWLGMARALEALGDRKGAGAARARAMNAFPAYLTWLDRN
jgi:tRNA A-37 threonylcarbamoyl transferase component Bud32